MLNEAEQNVIPLAQRPPRRRSSARNEVEQLRMRVQQHENALARMAEAVLTLRRGSEALREENRELRGALEAERRRRAAAED